MYDIRPTTRWTSRFVAILAAAAALGIAGWASAETLVPHEAEYTVKIKVLKGAMVTGLQRDESGYVGTSQINPLGFARLATKGSIENRSEFRLLGGDGVQPLAFEGKDTISKRKKHARLAFDWANGRVTGSASEKKSGKREETEVDAPAEQGMHDAVSLQYALMHDLQQDALREQYILLDGGKRKVINITRLEETSIRVPFGEFVVVPVQHQVESSSRVTTFWMARELNYLPVKIEQNRKGKRLMMAELGDYRPVVEMSSLQ